jgi:L-threonylcarbamoyladenylate synthase
VPGLASPGVLKSHYAPRTKLFLHDTGEMAALPYINGEGYLFQGAAAREKWLAVQGLSGPFPQIMTLSESGSLTEAAANLFEFLHSLDSLSLIRLHAERAAETGLGPAINDRLTRASADKSIL